MVFQKTDELKPGMILGKTLMSASGRVLLHAGVELRQTYIDKIMTYDFGGVYIDDEFTKDIEVLEVIAEPLRREAVTKVACLFVGLENADMKAVSKTVSDLKSVVYSIVDEIIASKGAVVNIIDLKNHDEYTFQHSVNVTVISVVLGAALGHERDWLFNLGMAALFHDIGKTKIPLNILNKPGKLTAEEFEEIKKHPAFGRDYIKNNFDMPATVYVSVLEHHEKYNGEGYPDGLSKGSILKQARIIAVADVYDAVTSRRPYSKPMEASDAFDLIVSNSSIHFDPEIVSVFTRTIAPFPIGTLVTLSDGRRGVVAKNYDDCILRPLIKLIPQVPENEDATAGAVYLDMKNDVAAMSVTIIGNG